MTIDKKLKEHYDMKEKLIQDYEIKDRKLFMYFCYDNFKEIIKNKPYVNVKYNFHKN